MKSGRRPEDESQGMGDAGRVLRLCIQKCGEICVFASENVEKFAFLHPKMWRNLRFSRQWAESGIAKRDDDRTALTGKRAVAQLPVVSVANFISSANSTNFALVG